MADEKENRRGKPWIKPPYATALLNASLCGGVLAITRRTQLFDKQETV